MSTRPRRDEPPREVSALPLGPYHPALPEPVWYQLYLQGETIARVEITTGYTHRGVEALLTQSSGEDRLKLAERLCGSAAHHHRLAFCLALEQLAQITAPPRARALHSLFCEVERLLSHLSWAAQVARVAEQPRAFYAAIEAHEHLLVALEEVHRTASAVGPAYPRWRRLCARWRPLAARLASNRCSPYQTGTASDKKSRQTAPHRRISGHHY